MPYVGFTLKNVVFTHLYFLKTTPVITFARQIRIAYTIKTNYMKKVITLLSVMSLLFVSCNKEDAYKKVVGNYTTVSIKTDAEVDLTGNGNYSNDVMRQMQDAGWYGFAGAEKLTGEVQSPFEINVVSENLDELIVEVIIPFPYRMPERGGKANVEMKEFRIYCQPWKKQGTDVYAAIKRVNEREYFKNLTLRFVGDEMILAGDIPYYSFGTNSYLDEHLTVRFRKNK